MSESPSSRMAGKRAFITGAAGGLGSAIARMLVRHGARVFLTDRAGEAVAELEADINANAGERVAWSAVQDVTDAGRWPRVLDEAAAAMGGLSVLVNNAGIGALGGVEALEPDDWRRVMGVNVEAVYQGCRHALPWLKRSTPAAIVNIASLAAFKVDPDFTVYNASKAAVTSLTRSVAIDCARQRVDVRCNSVHPAFVRTGIVEPIFRQLGEEDALRRLTRGIPLHRLGEPDDVAHAVLYLASDESRYVTAASLCIDGGASAV